MGTGNFDSTVRGNSLKIVVPPVNFAYNTTATPVPNFSITQLRVDIVDGYGNSLETIRNTDPHLRFFIGSQEIVDTQPLPSGLQGLIPITVRYTPYDDVKFYILVGQPATLAYTGNVWVVNTAAQFRNALNAIDGLPHYSTGVIIVTGSFNAGPELTINSSLSNPGGPNTGTIGGNHTVLIVAGAAGVSIGRANADSVILQPYTDCLSYYFGAWPFSANLIPVARGGYATAPQEAYTFGLFNPDKTPLYPNGTYEFKVNAGGLFGNGEETPVYGGMQYMFRGPAYNARDRGNVIVQIGDGVELVWRQYICMQLY
jgi:hypothetical protein